MAQYVVLLHSDLMTFGVYKTTGDPTDEGTWSAQDGAVWHGPGTIRSLWAVLDGTDIHIVSVNNSGGNNGGGTVRYSKFSTSSDTWTIESEFVAEAAEDSATQLGDGEYGVSIGVRSDGDVIVLYTHEDSVNNRPQCLYARRESGSWTVNLIVEDSASANLNAGVIILGSSDRMHFLYKDFTNGDVKSRTLNSANSLSSIATIDSETSTGGHVVARGVSYDDGGTQRVRVPYADLNQQISIAECDSADTPTWGTTVDASENDVYIAGEQIFACMAVDAKNLQLLYSGKIDQDIYRDQNDDDGGWGTDSEENDAVTCDRISCGVYARSGQKLGYIWDNGGTITFDEIDFVAFDTAVLAAMQQTIIPASVPIPVIAY